MYIKILFRLCLKDKKFISTNIYFNPTVYVDNKYNILH